jgi:hypothetical protein
LDAFTLALASFFRNLWSGMVRFHIPSVFAFSYTATSIPDSKSAWHFSLTSYFLTPVPFGHSRRQDAEKHSDPDSKRLNPVDLFGFLCLKDLPPESQALPRISPSFASSRLCVRPPLYALGPRCNVSSQILDLDLSVFFHLRTRLRWTSCLPAIAHFGERRLVALCEAAFILASSQRNR